MAKSKHSSLFDGKILGVAVVDSFLKLNPVQLIKNPVMFTVGVTSVLSTFLTFQAASLGRPYAVSLQIALWLWFTVLFGNFAEAVAEGRGKAQAESLRKTKTETMAKRL